MMTLNAIQQTIGSVNAPSSPNTPKTPSDSKLTDAAQQFEAILLEQMLKPFSSGSGDGLGGDETEKTPGSDTLSSFGTEAVAKAIAKGKGIGIARQIIEKVGVERAQHARAQI